MKNLKLYLFNIGACLFFLLPTELCFSQESAQVVQLRAKRKENETRFKDVKTSPLDSADVASFKGLNYYDPDPRYIVDVEIVRYKRRKKFKMPTSTDRLPVYRRWGELKFNLLGNEQRLVLYQNVKLVKKEGYEKHLFLPFTDLTNGVTTYGGGRFIDFIQPKSNKALLDFNAAYNPYCAYSSRWSCPIPPDENHLPIEVEAGENYITWRGTIE